MFLLLTSAVIVGASSNSKTCEADSCQSRFDDELDEMSLLQSKVVSEANKEEMVADETRALLTHREGRRRKGGGIGKVVKKASKSVSKTVSSVAKTVESGASQALAAAEKAVNNAVNKLKDPSTFKKLLPSCLTSGDIITGCGNMPSTSFMQKIDVALETSLKDIAKCFGLKALGKVVKDMKCKSSTKIEYPKGIDFNWPPKVEMDSVSLCTEISGLNSDTLKDLGDSAQKCGLKIYKTISKSIGSLKPSLLQTESNNTGCACDANFGIFFGAGGGAAAGVSAGISAGFVMGCDGCNFKFDGWWSWSAGLVSNVGADVAGTLGYVTEYDGFFGIDQTVEASFPAPNSEVVGGSIGVGLSVPQITINTEDKKSFGKCMHRWGV
jgi:hypothetical protein